MQLEKYKIKKKKTNSCFNAGQWIKINLKLNMCRVLVFLSLPFIEKSWTRCCRCIVCCGRYSSARGRHAPFVTHQPFFPSVPTEPSFRRKWGHNFFYILSFFFIFIPAVDTPDVKRFQNIRLEVEVEVQLKGVLCLLLKKVKVREEDIWHFLCVVCSGLHGSKFSGKGSARNKS